MDEKLPSCCEGKKDKAYKGILYGIIPHIGCILFVVASILGSTILVQFFKPLLMNRNIFYYMIAISIGFATLSSLLYLRKNKLLSWKGIRFKKKYLLVMYSLTIGINLLFFFIVFPLTANIHLTGAVISADADNSNLLLQVNIPCSGHASLISGELRTLSGVLDVKFSLPDKFEVTYDSGTNEKEILSLDVFKEYPAKVTGRN